MWIYIYIYISRGARTNNATVEGKGPKTIVAAEDGTNVDIYKSDRLEFATAAAKDKEAVHNNNPPNTYPSPNPPYQLAAGLQCVATGPRANRSKQCRQTAEAKFLDLRMEDEWQTLRFHLFYRPLSKWVNYKFVIRFNLFVCQDAIAYEQKTKQVQEHHMMPWEDMEVCLS